MSMSVEAAAPAKARRPQARRVGAGTRPEGEKWWEKAEEDTRTLNP